jgi:hypothetical protein
VELFFDMSYRQQFLVKLWNYLSALFFKGYQMGMKHSLTIYVVNCLSWAGVPA